MKQGPIHVKCELLDRFFSVERRLFVVRHTVVGCAQDAPLAQNVPVAMGANTLLSMTESYKKRPMWLAFWWRKPESVVESPNTGCSRGSKRERLRRALSQRLKHSQFSVKHRKGDFLKWSRKLQIPPVPATLKASPEITLKVLQQSGAIEVLGARSDKCASENEPKTVEGVGVGTRTEDILPGGESIADKKLASEHSLEGVQVMDHTLLSKIRSKWLKPDPGSSIVDASKRKPIAFLHEMKPGLTTTEISYTNA